MAPNEKSDLLHGYREIGTFLRLTPKQVEHRARARELPVFKLGRTVCARRSTLNAWIDAAEAAATRGEMAAIA